MKTLFFKPLILGCLFLLSCEKSTESITTTQSEKLIKDKLQGSWSLIKISGGIMGLQETYPKNKIIWTFGKEQVSIQDTYSTPHFVMLQNGIYTYNFENTDTQTGCTKSLNIRGIALGCVNFENSKLTLNQLYTDGFLLTFEKQ